MVNSEGQHNFVYQEASRICENLSKLSQLRTISLYSDYSFLALQYILEFYREVDEKVAI